MPMLPWPVCPLAGHATFGQNVVVGSMTILLSWLCWGAYQEEVCLDPRCLCNLTLPRFSVELPLEWLSQSGRRVVERPWPTLRQTEHFLPVFLLDICMVLRVNLRERVEVVGRIPPGKKREN